MSSPVQPKTEIDAPAYQREKPAEKVDLVSLEDLSRKLTKAIEEVPAENKLGLSEDELRVAKRLVRMLRDGGTDLKREILDQMSHAEMQIGARESRQAKGKKAG